MDRDIINRYDKNFYKIMAENFGDEIFVTDGEGVVLFLNPAAVKVIGKPITEIVGRNVRELVDEGFFKPSVTVEVIRQRRQVNLIQRLLDGRSVLCTGVPIFDDMQENIRMIISTTKDVDALNQMLDTSQCQEEKAQIIAYILRYKKEILSDEKSPKRDKIAVLLLNINYGLYRACWKVYLRLAKGMK